jgi:hypothetical protein
MVVNIIGLLLFGKLLEPLWGSKELSKFIFIVNLSTSACVFMTAIVLYYITQQEIYMYVPYFSYIYKISRLAFHIRSSFGVLTIFFFPAILLFLDFMGFYQDCWWALNNFYLIKSLIFLCCQKLQMCMVVVGRVKDLCREHVKIHKNISAQTHDFRNTGIRAQVRVLCTTIRKLYGSAPN